MQTAPDIQHNPAASRFEAVVNGVLCVIDYQRDGHRLVLPHVGVPEPAAGRGVAGALTKAALDWARAEQLTVVPICPYVQAWLQRHPAYAELL